MSGVCSRWSETIRWGPQAVGSSARVGSAGETTEGWGNDHGSTEGQGSSGNGVRDPDRDRARRARAPRACRRAGAHRRGAGRVYGGGLQLQALRAGREHGALRRHGRRHDRRERRFHAERERWARGRAPRAARADRQPSRDRERVVGPGRDRRPEHAAELCSADGAAEAVLPAAGDAAVRRRRPRRPRRRRPRRPRPRRPRRRPPRRPPARSPGSRPRRPPPRARRSPRRARRAPPRSRSSGARCAA